MSNKPMLTLQERVGGQQTLNEKIIEKTMRLSRVAMPGIIDSFDPDEQTVTVQPAIMERVVDEFGSIIEMALPLIPDVPIVFPRSGGFSLTMPISKGDECLIIFADSCIDAWWASGGVQPQEDIRRHDLSDAFAILGTWSQAEKVPSYSSTKAKLIHESSGAGVEVSNGQVKLTGAVMIGDVSLESYIMSFL